METDKAQKMYSNKREGKEIEKQLEPFAMWSFIFSIAPFLSLFGLFIPFLNIIFALILIPSPIISIVLGIVSFGNINANKKYYGKGFAIAGIIISIFQILIGILGIFFFMVAAGSII